MVLPADGHVHTEWSWDTAQASMERACARALELGLPAVVFSDHLDLTRWRAEAAELEGYEHLLGYLSPEGLLTPPLPDIDGYRECVERCRSGFPELTILTGVEFGQPHLAEDSAAELVRVGEFDRILGSLHCLQVGEDFFEPPGLFRLRPADEVIRQYLAELARMIEQSNGFDVLSHITYPVRHWPAEAEPFDAARFEDEFRAPLRLLAASGRALEVNTTDRLEPAILRWWREEGGERIAFGSDDHDGTRLGRRFPDAAAMAEANGFRPGSFPPDFWWRSA